MATARAHVRIQRSVDDVWKVIEDPDAIQDWFPAIESSKTTDGRRRIAMEDGTEVDEDVVTADAGLRRFQYTLVPGGVVPVERHLATVDVLEDGDGALVVYGVDVEPDAMGPAMQQMTEALTAALKVHLEA